MYGSLQSCFAVCAARLSPHRPSSSFQLSRLPLCRSRPPSTLLHKRCSAVAALLTNSWRLIFIHPSPIPPPLFLSHPCHHRAEGQCHPLPLTSHTGNAAPLVLFPTSSPLCQRRTLLRMTGYLRTTPSTPISHNHRARTTLSACSPTTRSMSTPSFHHEAVTTGPLLLASVLALHFRRTLPSQESLSHSRRHPCVLPPSHPQSGGDCHTRERVSPRLAANRGGIVRLR